MGNDGGSIPSRADMVKLSDRETSSAQVYENKQLNNSDLWTMCALSERELENPIVSDYKGRLYNKEAILELLLGASEVRQDVKHIQSLKDVVELKVTRITNNSVQTISCPITQKTVNLDAANPTRFVYLVPCGHVISESAIKQLSSATSASTKCPVCEVPYDTNDGVVVINPNTTKDLNDAEARIARLKAKGFSHSLKTKKTKKSKPISKGITKRSNKVKT